MKNNRYKGLIWTDHILERMKERMLSYEDVYWVFSKPDRHTKGEAPGSYKFERSFRGWKTVLVAKKNEKGEWIMMTCWVKPDNGSRVKKPLNFWQNLWRMLIGK